MLKAYDDRDGHIWMDGNLVPWRNANVHILTHALHYGSSVFEGERAYNGKIFKSREHSERLIKSGNYIDVPVPYSVDEIEEAKSLVLSNLGLKEAYIRAVCWRGSGEDMGVASQKNKVKMAIAAWEWGAYYGDAKTKGAKLDISKWNRPSPETIPSFAKAAGLYMICSMSKHSAEAKGCSDSLMRDYRGYVAEATGANIFFLRNGEVHTPLPDCFLNGITRQTIINIIKKNGFKVFERHIEINELENFEQCWLTGTAAEVTPVGQIGDYNFEVGSFVKDLVSDYENIVREWFFISHFDYKPSFGKFKDLGGIFFKLKITNKSEKDIPIIKELVLDIVCFLEDEKLFEIVTIPLKGKSQEADFMIVSSGNSSRQVSSSSEKLLEYLKIKHGILSKVEGLETANWVLIDSGDILINIFRPEVREYYQLEKMWMI